MSSQEKRSHTVESLSQHTLLRLALGEEALSRYLAQQQVTHLKGHLAKAQKQSEAYRDSLMAAQAEVASLRLDNKALMEGLSDDEEQILRLARIIQERREKEETCGQ